MTLRQTHTFAELEVPAEFYDLVAAHMREVGYDHVFVDGAIDMHGVGLTRGEPRFGPIIVEQLPPRPGEERITELLEANSRYLERARAAERRVRELEAGKRRS